MSWAWTAPCRVSAEDGSGRGDPMCVEGCGMRSVDPEAFSIVVTFAKARCLIQVPRFALLLWTGGLHLNDVAALFSKAKALVISSDREGSPKVLFESLFCNVPVLSTKCGIMSNFLPASSLAEVNDESFKDLLFQWVNNLHELEAIQEDCFKKVKEENLLSIQAKKVIRIYQDLFSRVSR